jgi:hypothetical protein
MSRGSKAVALDLTGAERAELRRLLRRRGVGQALAHRIRVVREQRRAGRRGAEAFRPAGPLGGRRRRLRAHGADPARPRRGAEPGGGRRPVLRPVRPGSGVRPQRRARMDTYRLQFYPAFETEFAHAALPGWTLVGRIHHRSGSGPKSGGQAEPQKTDSDSPQPVAATRTTVFCERLGIPCRNRWRSASMRRDQGRIPRRRARGCGVPMAGSPGPTSHAAPSSMAVAGASVASRARAACRVLAAAGFGLVGAACGPAGPVVSPSLSRPVPSPRYVPEPDAVLAAAHGNGRPASLMFPASRPADGDGAPPTVAVAPAPAPVLLHVGGARDRAQGRVAQ